MTHEALRPLFASKYERDADAILLQIAKGSDDRLNVQTSLSQLVDVDHPCLRAVAGKGFMLEATFDFVFTRNDIPIFAVEIDGPRHSRDPRQLRRDEQKDSICEVLGLPILRISTSLVNRSIHRRNILEYVVDTFYLAEAFFNAQDSGIVPHDEPFDRSSLFETSETGRVRRSLEHPAIKYLQACYDELALIPCRMPDVLAVRNPSRREVRCNAYLALSRGRALLTNVYVRDFRFVGISPAELGEALAIIEMAHQVETWLGGADVPLAVDRRRLAREFEELQTLIDAGNFVYAAAGSENAEVFGGLPPLTIHMGSRRPT